MARGRHLDFVGAYNDDDDDHSPARVADFYPTPTIAVEKLINYAEFDGPVWEPACGNGAISKYLTSVGFDVVSSDKYDWGFHDFLFDFLEHPWDQAFPQGNAPKSIITNPPYKRAEEFVRKALSVPDCKVAMLLRLQFLEGQKRRKLFQEFPPKVLVFSRRLPRMHRHGWEGKKTTSTMAFGWFIWNNYTEATIEWL